MNMMITEAPRETPVVSEVDLCVVGGGCTGVFAAVRAARMGLKVALVETLGHFGGAATSRMVNVWHSLWSTDGAQQIIGGLSQEAMERAAQRHAVIEREKTDPNWQFCFNSAMLSLILDEMIVEAGIIPFLHTRVVGVDQAQGKIKAVFIEDQSGRRAIVAKTFIDATGDAALVRQAGGDEAVYSSHAPQPPTTAFIMNGFEALQERAKDKLTEQPQGAYVRMADIVYEKENPYHIPKGFLWSAPMPGANTQDLHQVFGTRVFGKNLSNAEDLTAAEMEGRKQVGQIINAVNHYCGEPTVNLVALPACTGIRQTRQGHCHHQLTEEEVLEGVHFDDAIAYGSYRVDVHHQNGVGLTFRYQDGREVHSFGGGEREYGRWREERDLDPTWYEVPYRSIVPRCAENLWVVGRCFDADQGAFGALRVMVNCNQMGEAAGVAAAMVVKDERAACDIDVSVLRENLVKGGSVFPIAEKATLM